MGPNQIEKLLHSKGNHKKQTNKKRQPTEWEKIVSNDATDKGLISKIYKTAQQQKTNKQRNKQNKKKPNWKMGRRSSHRGAVVNESN